MYELLEEATKEVCITGGDLRLGMYHWRILQRRNVPLEVEGSAEEVCSNVPLEGTA